MTDRTNDRGPDTSPGFWLHHAYLAWRAACEARLGETRRLRLTEAGRQVLRACIAAARQADTEVFGTGPDIEHLLRQLRTVAERRTPPS
jgi:DNA-binding MarR family transcriptional regulator